MIRRGRLIPLRALLASLSLLSRQHSFVFPSKMPNQIHDIHSVDEERFPYILEQNVTVPLKSSEGLVRVNVYRPRTQSPVPVLATYGPYGKDIPYKE